MLYAIKRSLKHRTFKLHNNYTRGTRTYEVGMTYEQLQRSVLKWSVMTDRSKLRHFCHCIFFFFLNVKQYVGRAIFSLVWLLQQQLHNAAAAVPADAVGAVCSTCCVLLHITGKHGGRIPLILNLDHPPQMVVSCTDQPSYQLNRRLVGYLSPSTRGGQMEIHVTVGYRIAVPHTTPT